MCLIIYTCTSTYNVKVWYIYIISMWNIAKLFCECSFNFDHIMHVLFSSVVHLLLHLLSFLFSSPFSFHSSYKLCRSKPHSSMYSDVSAGRWWVSMAPFPTDIQWSVTMSYIHVHACTCSMYMCILYSVSTAVWEDIILYTMQLSDSNWGA